MKFIILAGIMLCSVAVSAQTLTCESLKKIEGWDGGNTYEKVKLSAHLSDKKIVDPVLNGAYKASYEGALSGKVSTNSKWIKYKYLQDAWCWYSVSVPADFNNQKRFAGFIDMRCEGYSFATVINSIQVNCQLR